MTKTQHDVRLWVQTEVTLKHIEVNESSRTTHHVATLEWLRCGPEAPVCTAPPQIGIESILSLAGW